VDNSTISNNGYDFDLIVRCTSKKLEVFAASTYELFSENAYKSGGTVQVRFDTGKIVNYKFTRSTDREAVFLSSPQTFSTALSKAKSKVIIFISDGVNNVGEISPLTAGELARTYGIRVYCIGVGSKGKALQPVAIYAHNEYEYDYVDVEIDEKVMTQISDMTGGHYFRATNKENLKDVYREIDKLEKTIISEKNFSNKAEHFLPFALLAAFALLLEFTLRYTLFRNTA
jgi:hypothetical protein